MEKKGNSYKYQKFRGIVRKLYLVDTRGGCCENCGYDKNLAALEFHHKDPNEKENQMDIRKLANSSMEWIQQEFEKCILLCANCHREEHSPHLRIENLRFSTKNNEQILQSRSVNKPNCVDCGEEIWYGSTRCKICSNVFKRTVERPTKEILIEDVNNLGFSGTGRKYSVSAKTIKKWLK